MGSGASKKSPTQPTGNQSTPRAPTTANRRAEFQEVEVRAPGNGRPANMSSRNNESFRDQKSPADTAGQRNRYGRHATSSGAPNSLQHGQSGAATTRSSPMRRNDLQDENVTFETFTHNNGREFICANRNGIRYYLDDWHSKDWQPFPERWYSEGKLSPLDDNYNTSKNSSQNNLGGAGGKQERDDREGFLTHPRRGRIETYLMVEKRYVHYFFDRTSGKWLHLPIGWELHHELVKQMVDYVEEALPNWKDRADILALLRVCNYSPDECIGTYLLLEGDEWLKPKRTSKDAEADENKDHKIEELTQKLKNLESELELERKARLEAEKQLQELRGNIRVFCRPRRDDRAQSCLKFPSDQDIWVTNSDGARKTFTFDKVYTLEATQEQIFADTQPIVTSCVDGYNVCLLAYGQTGSGKTFTMMGPENNPGINIRAISELLKICEERRETKTYTLKISMVEIYNETVQDLLTDDAKTLEIQIIGNIVKIPNITEVPVNHVKDIKRVMQQGDSNRKTASTKMNSSSSRSHLVLMLTVEGEDKVTGAISKGVLTLCDLAGSERISKSEATGQRLVEAAAINKSLSALGQVFSALRESQLHIPYRNSKLTQILKPCLGGDAKACLFVNVSPDASNFPETCNTLEFGSNARQVALGQAKQNIQRKPGFPQR
ncbi:unnamed protein product [Candidula unifasciata]|uniref:Kinesin-like protein n=1 Tax=Candidula unifasciata TaxID=100452 RepID=A0A8S3ZZR0_9EUPU|nr:unnamed protein product [Candidula unifasciata]